MTSANKGLGFLQGTGPGKLQTSLGSGGRDQVASPGSEEQLQIHEEHGHLRVGELRLPGAAADLRTVLPTPPWHLHTHVQPAGRIIGPCYVLSAHAQVQGCTRVPVL